MTEKKLIKIKIANPNSLRVNYVMTRSCTYECRYCPDNLHYGEHKKLNLKDLETFLDRFKHRDGGLQLTGGECTTHPQFQEIAQLAKNMNWKVLVDSNCVRTLRFYDEVKHLVDNWCITLHPSQHQLDLEKLKLLSEHSFLVVYVIMDPAYWELSLDWLDQVSKLSNLKVTPIRIMDDWGGADFKAQYTDNQLQYLATLKSKWLFTDDREKSLMKTHLWLKDTESFSYFDDGTQETFDTFSLIRSKKNNFFGWLCSAGRESICMFDDGSALWANCGYKRFDHFLDIFPEDIEDPVVCKFLECTCGTDVRGTKSIM